MQTDSSTITGQIVSTFLLFVLNLLEISTDDYIDYHNPALQSYPHKTFSRLCFNYIEVIVCSNNNDEQDF